MLMPLLVARSMRPSTVQSYCKMSIMMAAAKRTNARTPAAIAPQAALPALSSCGKMYPDWEFNIGLFNC